jgi:hypothetical protein
VKERLDWQFGPSLKEGSPAVEELGPDVTEEQAANAVVSIEDQEMMEESEMTVEKRNGESEEEDEGYESESESQNESEDEDDDPTDPDYVPMETGVVKRASI